MPCPALEWLSTENSEDSAVNPVHGGYSWCSRRAPRQGTARGDVAHCVKYSVWFRRQVHWSFQLDGIRGQRVQRYSPSFKPCSLINGCTSNALLRLVTLAGQGGGRVESQVQPRRVGFISRNESLTWCFWKLFVFLFFLREIGSRNMSNGKRENCLVRHQKLKTGRDFGWFTKCVALCSTAMTLSLPVRQEVTPPGMMLQATRPSCMAYISKAA